jgi:hypothetical protein
MDQSRVPSSACFRPCDAIMTSQIIDELMILDLNSGIYHSLNAVGTSIWNSLTKGRCQSEVVDAIASEFDVPSDAASRDIDAFIARLLALGLVKPA